MTDLVIRRVVVACEAVCEVTPAIETASRLAAHWRASLHAVILEDPGLRLAAALPFVRQVTLSPGGAQRFEPSEVEEHLRGFWGRVERVLAETASRLGLSWSLSAAPGTPSADAIEGGETDLLVMQAQARPFAGQFRLPSRLAGLLFRAKHPVLLLRGGPEGGHSVVLLLDPAARGAARSLAAAAELASLGGRRLVVLAKEPADLAQIRRAIAGVSEPVAARSLIEPQADLAAIGPGRLVELGAGLLVVDATAGDGEAAVPESIIARAPVDVLLVR